MSDEATIAIEETNVAGDRSRGRLIADLATSYGLAAARVGSNAVVVGLLYRYTTATWVAAFVLMRSMLGIVNYLLAGLGPATLHELTQAEITVSPIGITATSRVVGELPTLEYASRTYADSLLPSRRVNAFAASLNLMFLGTVLAMLFFVCFGVLLQIGTPSGYDDSFLRGVFFYGVGLVLRSGSEAAGAAMQRHGRLAIDNLIGMAGEATFSLAVVNSISTNHSLTFLRIGGSFLLSGLAIWTARWLAAAFVGDTRARSTRLDASMISRLTVGSLAISLGSFADFLYAPANVLLINRTLDPTLLAAYGPALQIDAALLLTVAAVAPVLLPRVAHAIAANDFRAARRMYVVATLVGLCVLLAGAISILAIGGPLLKLWLGEVPPLTLSILPLVLVHTVIGGTAGIGRAVLLGMGRFKAYTISALVGGVANVLLALLFVLGFGWGLRGIVCATIVAVVGRCAIWMPWYILRELRRLRCDLRTKATRVRA